jgi:D-alanyl-D-alanine-carboxypeptidase/D-alanyl-D-alanine-endopeptidase
MFRVWLVIGAVACGSAPPVTPKPQPTDIDPAGPHREAVAAQLRPFLDGEVVSGVVIGLYDAGKTEIYGFGRGPGGKPPDGRTLFDLGTLTKIYTGLLLAETVQRKEVELEAPISELMPPGVTIPTKDGIPITAKHLALHSSGLPRHPPSLLARKPPPDPFAGYGEDALYQDLVTTQLAHPPGSEIVVSDYGTGLLGFALGRKVGAGYAAAIQSRILEPLGLKDTFLTLPAGATARRVIGTDDDLDPAPRWTWGALGGAGAMVSSASDCLKFLDAQLDAAANSRGTLRPQMRLAQEPQLDRAGDNEALGWLIDPAGRRWYDGRTSGFRSYMGFDPKTRRGVVVLASTSTTLVDFLGPIMFEVLDNTAKPPAAAPTEAQLEQYVGTYDFSGTQLQIVKTGKRIYLEGPGEPRHRMAPYGERGFWIEDLSAGAKFVLENNVIKGIVFSVGGKQLTAPRIVN